VQLVGNEGGGPGTVRLASAAGRWVLAVAVLGEAMVLLEATVVNVALPSIGRDLRAGVAGLQWTLDGYVLTLAALVLAAGSLSDIYGRRRVFTLGTAVFVAASALCAAAPTIQLLVAARFVQGVGGALLTPGSLAIIDAVFHPDDRTRAIGAWAGLTAVAAAVGPPVGGYLTDALSWRAVFLINLPLGAFVIVAAVARVPESRDPTRARGLDLRGAALATLAIAGLCFALIQASGGLTPAVITAAAISLTAAAAFAAVERRSGHPMLPLELFRSRQFASATVLALVTYAALGGVIFLFVAFLQISLGYTALQAGAATLPITILLLIGSGPSGAIAQRIGPRIPLTAGAVLTGAGLLLMARIHPGDSYPRRRAFRHRLQRPRQAGSRLPRRHDHRRRNVVRGRAARLDHDPRRRAEPARSGHQTSSDGTPALSSATLRGRRDPAGHLPPSAAKLPPADGQGNVTVWRRNASSADSHCHLPATD
jgi:EmrB/QacA subfamily drug resistance transporter